jgi:hypothetical protein
MPFDSVKTTNKQIFVTFQKEGIHQYPGAPAGVEYLQYPHRHIFHFRVEIDVFHDDRDIEFILFKNELENLYTESTLELDYKSCEMMADDLSEYIYDKYPGRNFQIIVSEDGENGAICTYPVKDSNIIVGEVH